MKLLSLILAVVWLGAATAAVAQERRVPCSADPRCPGYNPPGGADIRPGADTRLTGTQPFRSGTSGSGTRPANRIQRQGVPQRQ